MLDLDNAFHRRAFELCGMEGPFDHMLSTFQHIERLRKFRDVYKRQALSNDDTAVILAAVQGLVQDGSGEGTENIACADVHQVGSAWVLALTASTSNLGSS